MKKYELIESEFVFDAFGVKLFRIRALVDIESCGVKKGDKGGFIESENNLSLVSGDAWVSGDARVYGSARVYGNARVSGDARVYGNAWVSGSARVYGNALVSGNARVSGNVSVTPLHLQGLRWPITILDSTVCWGCREFDWISLNQFTESDCTGIWDDGQFNRHKKIVIELCKEKWGIE